MSIPPRGNGFATTAAASCGRYHAPVALLADGLLPGSGSDWADTSTPAEAGADVLFLTEHDMLQARRDGLRAATAACCWWSATRSRHAPATGSPWGLSESGPAV